jgi:hypothetical protein
MFFNRAAHCFRSRTNRHNVMTMTSMSAHKMSVLEVSHARPSASFR